MLVFVPSAFSHRCIFYNGCIVFHNRRGKKMVMFEVRGMGGGGGGKGKEGNEKDTLAHDSTEYTIPVISRYILKRLAI